MSKTLLVVDDMAVFREPIAAALRFAGYAAISAKDGAEALQTLWTQTVDLILLDMAMPKMDGLEFLAQMRADPKFRNTPVILLTAVAQRDMIVRAATMGVQEYMLKSSFSLEDLVRRVRVLLGDGGKADAGGNVAAAVAGTPTGSSRVAAPAPMPKPQFAVRAKAGSGAAYHAVPQAARADQGKAPTAAPRACPVCLTRAETMLRLEGLSAGRTMAGVVEQIIHLAASPRSDLGDLARVIESDPVLASRILQLANSATFASGRARITSVEEAVRNIGIKTIHQFALTIGIFESFPKNTSDGFNAMRCWQHCYGTAVILNLIMEQLGDELSGGGHLIGLCHDLGELLLREHFATEYQEISKYAAESNTRLELVEPLAFGMAHHELVAESLNRIGLPPTIVQPIREFAEHQLNPGARMGPQARALSMANSLATALGLAASPEASVAPILRSEWKILAKESAPPLLDARGLRSQILTTTNVLARLPAEDEANFLKPLLPRTGVRVWYVRSTGFLDSDPLELALQSLAEVTIAPMLPGTHAQWSKIDALVLSGPRPEASPLSSPEVHAACSQAGYPNFPVLFLAGQDQPTPLFANIRLIRYPVTLAVLAAFLGRIPRRPG